MANPLFTIGIPTFNRAEFLKESLSAATNQTYQNLQIVVSDNASTDHTQAVVNSFDDARITYHRNETNIGALGNFARTLELARGSYFSWLQDDDVIFHNFVEDAVGALQTTQAGLYMATAVHAEDPSFLYWKGLYGPPWKLNWNSARPDLTCFHVLLPVSLFVSFAIPPVIAFETEALRKAKEYFVENDCPLFGERLILAAVASRVKAVVAPRISGVFRNHDGQSHKCDFEGDVARQWNAMVGHLDAMATQSNWNCDVFRDYLATLPDSIISSWCGDVRVAMSSSQICSSVRRCLIEVAKNRGIHPSILVASDSQTTRPKQLRRFMKMVVPPVLPFLCRKISVAFAKAGQSNGL